jgi:hypothetical protein
VYAEAALLLYSSNTFSFHDGLDFADFIPKLIPAQARQLKSLRFEVGVDDQYHGLCTPAWSHALTPSNAKALPGLRHLHVDLTLRWEDKEAYQEGKDRIPKCKDTQAFASHSLVHFPSPLDGLLNFRRCELQSARVTVAERRNIELLPPRAFRPIDFLRQRSYVTVRSDWRWTLAQKQALAKALEAKLLEGYDNAGPLVLEQKIMDQIPKPVTELRTIHLEEAH